MSCICRTCLSEITSNRFVDINLSEFASKQLQLCIPELDLDLVLEPVLCLKCVEALSAVHDFKSCCLQTEQRIHAYVAALTTEQQHVELDAVVGNNYNGINSMEMHCGNDITNDLSAVHVHSRTRLDLEDYKDAKGECFVTSENCSFDDGVEVNNDGFKEESIKIEEHEWDNFIKHESEMFDTGSDAEITYNLRQWSEFENGFNLELQDCSGSSQQQDVDSNEQLEGLLRQCNKLDPVNYNSNNENWNWATTSAQFSTKQGNSVTKSQVGVVSMQPNSSSPSVRLLRQRKGNVTKIADISNIHSVKRRFNNISSIKSHSRINKPCKRANRRLRYRCRQKEKNIEEQIIAKSELHSELLKDCRIDSTRMDISSDEEILNVDNYAVMKGVGTQVKKSSPKCDRNIKSNNTAATEAETDINSVIDHSQLHLKHSNASALNNSNTNVPLQHFINSNNLSVQVKNEELSVSSHFINTIGKNLYKCDQCDYACSQKSILKLHNIRNHSGKKSYTCNVCNYACSAKTPFNKHLRTHTGEKPYKCGQCDYTCSQKSNLIIHNMRKHTGEKPYKCDQCDYACSTKNLLKLHIRKHTGEKPYKCDQCDYACSQKSILKLHNIRNHSGKKSYTCNVCNYACSAKTPFNRHLRTHTGEKPYKCGKCDYACSQKSNLKLHNMRNHSGEKPYKCDQCDYAYSTKYILKLHIRKHTGEQPYKCDQCDYACSYKNDLRKHTRRHTGEKPYKCNVCNYACSTKTNLKIHLRKHTGEKPYKCDQCKYACSRKNQLIIHIRNHTGEKPYTCNVCNYAYSAKTVLNIHLRTHTGEKPYKCNQCKYACSRKDLLIIHTRNHTGEKPYKCDQCEYAASNKSNLNYHLTRHTGEKP